MNKPFKPHKPCPDVADKYRGALVGGAIGDALGAPVEFMSRDAIFQAYGRNGITRHHKSYGKPAAITDDTQMTLFTAEGLLRAWVRAKERGLAPAFTSITAHALQRWLLTQDESPPRGLDIQSDGWLIGHRELHNRRAPGNTCLSALRKMKDFTTPANNNSKGCGGVMRVAPIGMLTARSMTDLPDREFNQQVFDLGRQSAAITHGHISGQLPAGVLCLMIALLLRGEDVLGAATRAYDTLVGHPGHEETSEAIHTAIQLARHSPADPHALVELGQGWVAEEALAISLYCALSCDSFAEGVVLAVNHDGDSDSTGAITGNILGAYLGIGAIPDELLFPLELRQVIQEVADDLATTDQWVVSEYSPGPESDYYWSKYPGY